MQLVDPRRLTGRSHLARHPLVIVELAFVEEERAAARSAYLAELGRMREALGLPGAVDPIERPHSGGTVIGYREPIDVMLACTEMSEWAALSACELLAGRPALPLEPKRAEIEGMLARDRSPRLVALEAEAARRGLPFLWDDELVSIGLGVRSQTWPRGQLPDDVAWDRLGTIPVALVTGTNGKTTSTRLLARIAREAGRRVGSTSSDAVTVGADVIEEGDWTGPAAARLVLQRTDVDFAVLETARGGILRRGLAVDTCDVALLTNVTDDHLGSYGIDDLDAMAKVKAVTMESARIGVVNARDARLVALAARHPHVVYFADLEDAGAAEVVAAHRAKGGEAVVARGGEIVHARGVEEKRLTRIEAVPLTLGGAARFNIENVLGAVAAAFALELPEDAIVRAIERFTPADNPRRTGIVERGGVRILLDFGHNPDGVRQALRLAQSLGSGRLTVITGSAGDRSDRELEAIAKEIHAARPHRVLLRELPDYLRGRQLGEVPEIFRRAFVALGMAPEAIMIAGSEVDALRVALDGAAPGDLVVLLVHLEEEAVRAFLATPG